MTTLFGLPVATPESAWCQAAAMLSRDELVAVGDELVTGTRSQGRRAPSVTSVEALADEAARHVRSPGGTGMSWALARIRSGVDSPQETLLRLTLVRFRLPEPSTDVEIHTALGVLHADLGYPDRCIAIEYEGDGHRERAQWMRDIQRREAMEDAGWRVIRVVAADLRPDPRGLVDRIRRILSSRASLSAQRHTKGKIARLEGFRR